MKKHISLLGVVLLLFSVGAFGQSVKSLIEQSEAEKIADSVKKPIKPKGAVLTSPIPKLRKAPKQRVVIRRTPEEIKKRKEEREKAELLRLRERVKGRLDSALEATVAELTDNRGSYRCSVITAKHYKSGKAKSFAKCVVGEAESINSGSVEFYVRGGPFKGLVVKKGDDYIYYDQDEVTLFTDKEKKGTSIGAEETPDVINCGNPQKRSKYQCLVCNCFHEARGQSFDEQVRVNRTILSRVLSPKHPGAACDVLYHPNAYSWTHEKIKGTKLRKQDIQLNENSKAFKRYFPGETNSLRSCKRASLESLKYENDFFAVSYIKKGHKPGKYHRACKGYAETSKGGSAYAEKRNQELNINKNLAHIFYSVCEEKEERCLYYATCSVALKSSPVPRLNPAKPTH